MKTKIPVCLFNFQNVTSILCFCILILSVCGNSKLSQEKKNVTRDVHGNETCESDFLWSPDNERCYKIKLPERSYQKYEGCSGNEVPIDFYKDKYKNINLSLFTRFWTDYKRVYPHGPFINWRVGDENMGQPEFSLGLSNFSNGHDEKMCATVDIETLVLMPTNCDLKFPRLCVLKPGQDPLQVLPKLTINFVKTIYDDVMIFNTTLNVSIESDVNCFTDAVLPGRVNILRKISDSEFEVKAKYNGYYWCLSVNTGKYLSNESERILFVKNKEYYLPLFVIMVKQKEFFKRVGIEFEKNRPLYKYYCSDECKDKSEEFYELPEDECLEAAKDFQITHFYKDKIFFHGVKNDFLHKEQCSPDILDSRPILFCEPNGSIPRLNTGETKIITNDFDECQLLKCEGDFYVGGHWNISDFSNNNCPSLKTQIDETINTVEGIIRAGPVNESRLTIAVDEINKVLKLKDVEIPPIVLQELDSVLEQVHLLKDQVQITVKRPNLDVMVAGSTNDVSIIGFKVNSSSPEFEDSSTHVLTPATIIDVNETNLIIVNVSTIMKAKPMAELAFVHFRDDRAFQQTSGNITRVNSPVVSVSINNVSSLDKGQYIDIYFRPFVSQRNDQKKECAYWDFNIGSTGEWSTTGCVLISERLGSLDICRCYHLTHFAQILTSSDVTSITEGHYIALTIISTLGCSLSIIGLVIIALTAVIFRKWSSDFVHRIWINLSAAVGVMVILFIVVAELEFEKNSVICIGLGIALHYSVLSVFCWMFVTAMVYYQMIVNAFKSRASDDRIRILKAILFGWLIPVIPIGPLLYSNPFGSYTQRNPGVLQHKFCYPSGMGLWLAVVLPAVLVVILNTLLFLHITFAFYKSAKLKKHDKEKKQMFGNVKQLMVLFYQFDLIWIFGFLSNNLIAAYVFCITATLQGLVLCYCFVIGNTNTRNLWKDKIRLYRVSVFSILTDTSTLPFSGSKLGRQPYTENLIHKTPIEEDNVSLCAQVFVNRTKRKLNH